MAIPEFTTEELETEEWRDIVGYEGIYSVSTLGRIRRDASGKGTKVVRILRPTLNQNRYWHVTLGQSRRIRRNVKIHLIVAAAFLGGRPSGRAEVNHKDGVKSNNRLSNLEYVTPSENIRHAFRTGLKIAASGERHFSRTKPERVARGDRHGNTKLKDSEIPRIFKLRTDGLTLKQIGDLVGLSKHQVRNILLGKSRATQAS